jgi:hypothetical protein
LSAKIASRTVRATYHRLGGTEHFLGIYDVHLECLAGTIHRCKTVADVLAAFTTLRKAHPRRIKLYVIKDNLPLRKSSRLLEYYAQNRITPASPPTYS